MIMLEMTTWKTIWPFRSVQHHYCQVHVHTRNPTIFVEDETRSAAMMCKLRHDPICLLRISSRDHALYVFKWTVQYECLLQLQDVTVSCYSSVSESAAFPRFRLPNTLFRYCHSRYLFFTLLLGFSTPDSGFGKNKYSKISPRGLHDCLGMVTALRHDFLGGRLERRLPTVRYWSWLRGFLSVHTTH